VGELLWELVKLYGKARVMAFLAELDDQGPGAPLEQRQTQRIELVTGVPDAGFELLDRDNTVYEWDEPPSGGEDFSLPVRRNSRRNNR
jgi:hypothetical protein